MVVFRKSDDLLIGFTCLSLFLSISQHKFSIPIQSSGGGVLFCGLLFFFNLFDVPGLC